MGYTPTTHKNAQYSSFKPIIEPSATGADRAAGEAKLATRPLIYSLEEDSTNDARAHIASARFSATHESRIGHGAYLP